jgi:acyl-CoA synthetase (AMP-forming)/AMP-acid ligase II
MILDSPETIRAYTDAGWWGTDTLDDLFRRNAAANPERLALVDPPNRPDLTVGEPKRLTYAEAAAATDALAAELARRGIGPGDIVMVQLPNVVELPLLYLAAARIGAIVSPLPVQYRQHELRHTVGHTEPKLVITAANVSGFDHAAMVREVAPGVPVITIGEELDAILATPAGDLRDPGATANDILTICWTSGTEAEPKGVPRSHNHWIAIGWGTTDGARLADGDVLLNPFPMVNMSGIGGMFVPWLQVAGALVMHHPMALPVFLGQIGRERANYTVAPPILLTMLLANEQLLAAADFSSMKVIGSGSAPLSAAMVVGWKERFGIDVTNFFGSNEGTGLVGDPATVPDPEERARYFPRFGAPGTDGEAWGNRAARGTETKLVDPLTGAEVTEPDVAAELAFRGPTRFPGYWRRPEMTARAIDRDGYYHTGDLFEIAGERGDRLRFIGRARDLIIRGGMKVAPEELEALISRHPAVAEVAVVGVEDRRMEGEQRICVACVLKPDASLSIGELRRWLGEQQIAAYKMPKELLVLDALPRNPLGKVTKRDLRMRFEGRGAAPSVGESEEATTA